MEPSAIVVVLQNIFAFMSVDIPGGFTSLEQIFDVNLSLQKSITY